MTDKIDPKDLKLEQAMKILESISERMTSENTDLESLLVLYEEGMQYLKICREKLAEAEMKVRILNEKLAKEMPQEEENG
ncbi:MAG: exodeoxyribonuclease VII small subunit [Candidatus Cloacimonadaceae bacterium]